MKGVADSLRRRCARSTRSAESSSGASAYTDTQGEYLSSYGSNTAEEMDCLDCHDAALVAPGGYYMAHANPPVNNPYMLLSAYVTVGRPVRRPLPLLPRRAGGRNELEDQGQGHPGDLAPGRPRPANALAEIDGTLLLTSDPGKDGTADTLTNQCASCHATHSSGNAKLFVSAYSGGTDCTACHLGGRPVRQLYQARARQDDPAIR